MGLRGETGNRRQPTVCSSSRCFSLWVTGEESCWGTLGASAEHTPQRYPTHRVQELGCFYMSSHQSRVEGCSLGGGRVVVPQNFQPTTWASRRHLVASEKPAKMHLRVRRAGQWGMKKEGWGIWTGYWQDLLQAGITGLFQSPRQSHESNVLTAGSETKEQILRVL